MGEERKPVIERYHLQDYGRDGQRVLELNLLAYFPTDAPPTPELLDAVKRNLLWMMVEFFDPPTPGTATYYPK